MRYGYNYLGTQPEGSGVVVRWRGSAANVLLLDPVNFSKYREGRMPVVYSGGGHYRRSPARLSIPQEGRWYVVADLGGYSAHPEPTVELLEPSGEQQATHQ
jgi:hypothetical protein